MQPTVGHKGDLLRPYGGQKSSPEFVSIPGFDGTRPLLSFILKVLSGKYRKMVRRHIEFWLYFDFQCCTPKMEGAKQRMTDHPEIFDYAVESITATMREMVDMWIDSGKSGTDMDVDTPTDRNVEDVLPGRTTSLYRLFNSYLFNEYPRYIGMRRDGTQSIKDTTPRFNPERLSDGLMSALEAYGRMMAAYYIACLLDSPDSHRITRCDDCNAYFAYKRARLRTVKHGVRCPKCEPNASVIRTEASRLKKFDTAARAFVEWESARKNSAPRKVEQWEWITNRVNHAHGTSFGKVWTNKTKTKLEIQKRVEALRNATRKS